MNAFENIRYRVKFTYCLCTKGQLKYLQVINTCSAFLINLFAAMQHNIMQLKQQNRLDH